MKNYLIALAGLLMSHAVFAIKAPPPSCDLWLKTTTTQHQIQINQQPLRYSTTVGLIPIYNQKHQCIATMSYIAYHVKKTTKDINDIEFPLRPHCFHLHGMYKSTNAPITFDRVMKYLNTLEPAQLVFCINYKYRKNNKTDEQSSNAEAEAEP